MPSPKSGTEVSADAPAAALDADTADPGQVAEIKAEQARKGSGKYGSTAVGAVGAAAAASSSEAAEEDPDASISFELKDDKGNPVAGERYSVTVPGRADPVEGTLDGEGKGRVAGFPPGNCKISFPDIDGGEWNKE